jgi:hypothetical protein
MPQQSHDSSIMPLGPLVATQKATHAIAWLMIGLGAIMLPLSIAIAFMTHPGKSEPQKGATAVAIIFGGAAFTVLGFGLRKRYIDRDLALALHEKGLRQRWNGRETIILFENADELSFDTTRVIVNTAYVGTNEFLGVRQGTKSAYFFRQVKEENPWADSREPGDVDRLASAVTGMVAEKLADRLLRGEVVEWTNHFRLTSTALHIASVPWWRGDLRTFFRDRRWQHVEWAEIERREIEYGVYRLWLYGEKRPRVTLRTDLPNFFPGLLLFNVLVSKGVTALDRQVFGSGKC